MRAAPLFSPAGSIAGGLQFFWRYSAVLLSRPREIPCTSATRDPRRVRHIKTIAQSRTRSKGSSLLEVLIAILVTAIGLLGLAKLHAVGLKYNQVSYLRGIATQQAYDMSDRMRANLDAVYAGGYDAVTAAPGTEPTCYPTTACSPTEMVQHDIYAWNTANAALLPGGSGTVTHSATTPFTITVSWTEKCTAAVASNAGDTGCSSTSATAGTITRTFTTSFQL